MTEAQYLAGRLLLAMPGMGDPRFDHAVIALVKHDAEGAFGIGIGHVLEGTGFHAVLDDLGIDRGVAPDAPVHAGGPVEPQRGFVIHSPDWQEEQSLEAGPFGIVSGSLNVLRAIAEGKGPSRWILALGYAGWSAGQLDGEMTRHGWYSSEVRESVLWDTPAEKRWAATWLADGIDPALLVGQTGRA